MSLSSALLAAYDVLWAAAPRLLRRNARLREGWEERLLRRPLPEAALWLQAASAGEAFLAVTVLRALERLLPEGARLSALATTNTRQGRDILDAAAKELRERDASLTLLPAYCPFDRPRLMREAMRQVRPAAVVLLETELWPGLMAAAREHGARLLVANGRMSTTTLARMLPFADILRPLGPHEVLAISERDAARYAALYPAARTRVVPNVKFDQLPLPDQPPAAPPLDRIAPPGSAFVILGSVREQEEAETARAATAILAARPDAVIGLFPRHMERLDAWTARLSALSLPCARRSALRADGRAAAPGSVVLWDVFGELGAAFAAADAAFVGGSLAPLGGQNFLEPLAAGLVPVIGPHWHNFAWVGREITELGLAREVRSGAELAQALLDALARPRSRSEVRAAFAAYLAERRGGAAAVASRLADLARPQSA